MEIIPAIDLLNGLSVRLAGGAEASDAGGDPLEAARRFAAEGARRLHLTDLNGVLEGMPRHLELAGAIVEATGLSIQMSGGFRRLERIEAAVSIGIDRIILGQAAVESPAFLESACQTYGARIALALEIEGNQVSTRDVSLVSNHLWADVLAHADSAGLARLVVTSLDRPGKNGRKFAWLEAVRKIWGKPLIVAGGISSLEEVRVLADWGQGGPEAVVVGRALHERRFGLVEAMRTGDRRAQ